MNFTDHEEMAERRRRRNRRRRSDVFWNFLTVCVILATIALIGVMLMIYSNPNIALNPFPPPTMPALVVLPTSTPTLVVMPPTWTPTSKATETSSPVFVTATPNPTATETVTPGADVTQSTSDATESSSAYAFELQGTPAEIRSTVFKPDTGCEWQGVAGQVVDLQGKPLLQITVVLTGVYNGKTVNMTTISGTHTEYGESGYEFQLNTELVESTGSLTIQLVDQSFLPLSEKVVFNTYATCDKNLIIINFKQAY